MKRTVLVGLLLAGCTASGEAPPQHTEMINLVGEWTGSRQAITHYDSQILHFPPGEDITYEFDLQEGRLFSGMKFLTRSADSVAHEEAIMGAISADGRELYLTDRDSGYSIGRVLGPDEIEITYLHDGSDEDQMVDGVDQDPIDMVVAVHTLRRVR